MNIHSSPKSNARAIVGNPTGSDPAAAFGDELGDEITAVEALGQALQEISGKTDASADQGRELLADVATATALAAEEGGAAPEIEQRAYQAVQQVLDYVQEQPAPILQRASLRRMQQQQAADAVRDLIAGNDQQLSLLGNTVQAARDNLEAIEQAARNSLNAQRADLFEELSLLEDGLRVYEQRQG